MVEPDKRQWIGRTAGPQGQSVYIQWPTRENWDTCRSYPVVLYAGQVLKRSELRELRSLLEIAGDDLDAAISDDLLPWERTK